jgi:hypothetical protein
MTQPATMATALAAARPAANVKRLPALRSCLNVRSRKIEVCPETTLKTARAQSQSNW